MSNEPERVWIDGDYQNSKLIRHNPPSSSAHPQSEYIRRDIYDAATARAEAAEAACNHAETMAADYAVRLKDTEAKVKDMALDCLAAKAQAADAYQAQLLAEAKVEDAADALRGIVDLGGTMGSALYAKTVDRAARDALAKLRGEGET